MSEEQRRRLGEEIRTSIVNEHGVDVHHLVSTGGSHLLMSLPLPSATVIAIAAVAAAATATAAAGTAAVAAASAAVAAAATAIATAAAATATAIDLAARSACLQPWPSFATRNG